MTRLTRRERQQIRTNAAVRGVFREISDSMLLREIVRGGSNFITSVAQSSASNPLTAYISAVIALEGGRKLGIIRPGVATGAELVASGWLVGKTSAEIIAAIGTAVPFSPQAPSPTVSLGYDVPDVEITRQPRLLEAPRDPATGEPLISLETGPIIPIVPIIPPGRRQPKDPALTGAPPPGLIIDAEFKEVSREEISKIRTAASRAATIAATKAAEVAAATREATDLQAAEAAAITAAAAAAAAAAAVRARPTGTTPRGGGGARRGAGGRVRAGGRDPKITGQTA